MSEICLMIAVLVGQAEVAVAAERAEAPPAVPEWVARGSWFEPPVRFRVVSSELWATPEQALEDALGRAGELARALAAEAVRIPGWWRVPGHLVHDGFVRDEHIEKVDWEYGPMYRSHLLVELSPAQRDVVLAEWRRTTAERRLGQLAAGFGFVVLCLTSLLAYLKLDDATRGYYTRWLLTAALAVVAGSAAVLYRWFA